jgi:hypothetical protein
MCCVIGDHFNFHAGEPIAARAVSQRGQTLIDARLHRAQGALHEVGNFLEGQAVILLQDDGLTLLRRKGLHRPGHLAAQLASRRQIFNRLDGTTLGGQLLDIDALGHRDKRRAPFFPHPVAAQIERDPVEPGRKLGVAFEAGQRAECAEKGFLRDIARVFLATERPVRQGEDRPLPSLHQLIEAVHIAGLGSRDQLLVGPRPHRNCSCKRCHALEPTLVFTSVRRHTPRFGL